MSISHQLLNYIIRQWEVLIYLINVCRFKDKKWYWPIFIYLLDASISNSWQIFRHSKNQIPLLEFRREIALDLLQSGAAPKKDYKKRTVRDNLRYDGIDHFITKIQNRRRCQGCSKKTFYQCSKWVNDRI